MNRRIEWTEERLQYLREHYPTGTAHEIALFVGCSDDSVNRKAHELGIRKDPSFRPQNFIGTYVKRGVINGKINSEIKK